MKKKMLADFQICINVPLRISRTAKQTTKSIKIVLNYALAEKKTQRFAMYSKDTWANEVVFCTIYS